ncbi:hypothetical protein KQX54_010921 [Cotesia glomerata]|uniref:Protein kinase domain-containing protein n=1 Tax=Cotesia glomerata TaxID=32391 RepID=A0AAV7HX38_COTGL|nr:hypothetical protein KQX54_010921 [Cotesia glomerata]
MSESPPNCFENNDLLLSSFIDFSESKIDEDTVVNESRTPADMSKDDDDDNVCITYERVVVSQYSNDLSIAFYSKEDLYYTEIENVGHLSMDEFDPVLNGYKIFFYFCEWQAPDRKYHCVFSCKYNSLKKEANKAIKNDIPDLNINRLNSIKVPMIERAELQITDTILGAGTQGVVRKGLWKNTSVDHPNVIKTLGICVETNRLFITMELFTGTTLMNYIFNEYNINCEKLTTDMKHAIGRQICLSINYLHTRANPVIHGDIKPSNILVNPQMVVKVCDMGLSRFAHVTKSLVSTMHHQAQSPKRTLMYMAPEILKNKLPTIKSEVWSLACTLVELYQESSIWEVSNDTDLKSLLNAQTTPNFSSVPKELVKILSNCFNYQSNLRPKISEVLNIYEKMT